MYETPSTLNAPVLCIIPLHLSILRPLRERLSSIAEVENHDVCMETTQLLGLSQLVTWSIVKINTPTHSERDTRWCKYLLGRPFRQYGHIRWYTHGNIGETMCASWERNTNNKLKCKDTRSKRFLELQRWSYVSKGNGFHHLRKNNDISVEAHELLRKSYGYLAGYLLLVISAIMELYA